MINKDSFVKIMESLRNYNDAIDILYDGLGINMDDNELTRVLDNTLDALVEDVEPDFDSKTQNMPWCYKFAFEHDWGRSNGIGAVEVGGKSMDITTAAELYDFLTAFAEAE